MGIGMSRQVCPSEPMFPGEAQLPKTAPGFFIRCLKARMIHGSERPTALRIRLVFEASKKPRLTTV